MCVFCTCTAQIQLGVKWHLIVCLCAATVLHYKASHHTTVVFTSQALFLLIKPLHYCVSAFNIFKTIFMQIIF